MRTIKIFHLTCLHLLTLTLILSAVQGHYLYEDYDSWSDFGTEKSVDDFGSGDGPEISESDCGGYITTTGRQFVFLYFTNPLDPTQTSTCVWVIRASNGGPLALLLHDHNFSGPNGTTASLTLQNGFGRPEGTVSRPILPQDKDQTILHVHFASALVFTSNGGQGFRLLLRDTGSHSLVNHIFNIEIIRQDNLTLYKHPKQGLNYPPNQITHLILQSSPGKVINLNVDYVDTEAGYDILVIFQYSQVQKKFLILRTFSGHLGRLFGATFETLENEPMIVHFVTDGSTQYTGFQFSYSYRDPGSIATTELVSTMNPMSNSCGGFLILQNLTELTYTNLGDPQDSSICVWTLWARFGGPIGFVLVEQNYTSQNGSDGTLSFHNGFGSTEDSSVARVINSAHIGRLLTQDFMASVLVFVSRGGQGFKMQLRGMGLNKAYNSTARSVIIQGGSNETEIYSLPPNGGQYNPNEWRFIIMEGSPGREVHLTVDYVDTEHRHDFLKVFKYSRVLNSFVLMRKFTGHLGHLEDTEPFIGNDNQPMILYFHSDNTVEGLGFKFYYSYQPTDTGSRVMPTVPSSPSSGTCGGVVDHSVWTQLTYANNNISDVPETCLWVIEGSLGGRIELILNEFNFTGQPPVLTIHSGLAVGNNSVPRRLLEDDKETEIIYRDGKTLLVTFTSTFGKSFKLTVKNFGVKDRRFTSQAQSLKMGDLGRFRYPLVFGTRYLDNEQRYIIFQAAKLREIYLLIEYIDTEGVLDTLSIFNFNSWTQKFQKIKSLSGHVGTLRVPLQFYGDQNQPMVLYFETDGSAVFLGFSLTYSYQPPGQRSATTANPILTTSPLYNGPRVFTLHSYTYRPLVTSTIRPPVTFSRCGGLVELSNVTDINYTNTGSVNDLQVCIWTLWASNGGPIGLRLIRHNPIFVNGSNVYGALSTQNGFATSDSSSVGQSINPFQTAEVLHNFVSTILVFVSHGGQGFNLRSRGLGLSISHLQWGTGFVSIEKMTDESTTFSYPPDGAQYKTMDTQTIVLKGFPLRRIQINVDFIHLESRDFLKIYKFSKIDNKFLFLRKFSGPKGEIEDAYFEGNENEPMLLYFYSDLSGSGDGFKFSYIYQTMDMSLQNKSKNHSDGIEAVLVGQSLSGQQGQPDESKETRWEVYLVVVVGLMTLILAVSYTIFYAKKPFCVERPLTV